MEPRLFEAVIGLEVHVQLLTRSKMFCACANAYGGEPNSRTCPVCLALPGALPVLERRSREDGHRPGPGPPWRTSGAAATSTASSTSIPTCPRAIRSPRGPWPSWRTAGWRFPAIPPCAVPQGPVRAGIERAHLEEDAGKSSHDAGGRVSLVDLNRAGVPLLEIVGRPDLRSPQEASDYLKALHRLVTFLGICDGNLEEGSFRCDANVSRAPARRGRLRHPGGGQEHQLLPQREAGPGTRDRAPDRAAASGARPSSRRPGAGTPPRGRPAPSAPRKPPWTTATSRNRTSRPSPSPPRRSRPCGSRLPELPEARKVRFMAEYGLTDYEAGMVLQDRGLRGLLRGRGPSVRQRQAGRQLDARGGEPGPQRAAEPPSPAWASSRTISPN